MRAGWRLGWRLIALPAVAWSAPPSPPPPPATLSADLSSLWQGTVDVWLRQPLWQDARSYDASSFLMVPLHAAFQARNPAQMQAFRAHFRALAEAWQGSDGALVPGLLNQLQYLYLASRYLALEQGLKPDAAPGLLETQLTRRLEQLWDQQPRIGYGERRFAGLRGGLDWKLGPSPARRGYEKAIGDDELFFLAIAGDLAQVLRLRGTPRPAPLSEILASARRVFDQGGQFRADGGWVFQPGAWTDHPDFRYAGRTVKASDLQPAPVPGIAWDTSHGHRFPLWLLSLREAEAGGSPAWRDYDRMLAALGRQFCGRVLVRPTAEVPYYRVTNYLDGSNGIFRWRYPSLAEGEGYGPYQLSGCLLLGWWGFLPDPEVRRAYVHLARNWPPPAPALDLYEGPRAAQERSRAFLDLGSPAMRFRELIVRLLGDFQEPAP